MKIEDKLMKTSENSGKIMNKYWAAKKLKKHEWTIKKSTGKPKESEKNKQKPTTEA
jgi:hypothetical protein